MAAMAGSTGLGGGLSIRDMDDQDMLVALPAAMYGLLNSDEDEPGIVAYA